MEKAIWLLVLTLVVSRTAGDTEELISGLLDSQASAGHGCSAMQQLWARIDALQDTSATTLLPLLGTLHRAGISAVWNVHVAPDPYISTVLRIWLGWPGTLVSHEQWVLVMAAIVLGSEYEATRALAVEAQLVALMQKAGDGYVETQHLRYDGPSFAPHCSMDNRATPETKGYNRTVVTTDDFQTHWHNCASMSMAVSGFEHTHILLVSSANDDIGEWTAQYSFSTETWVHGTTHYRGAIYITHSALSRDECFVDFNFLGKPLSGDDISTQGAARAAYLEALFDNNQTFLPFAYAAAGGYVDDALALVSEQTDLESLRAYLKLRVAVAMFAINDDSQQQMPSDIVKNRKK
jgi:hypothetical protein